MSSTTLRNMSMDKEAGVCDFELEIEDFLNEYVILVHKGQCLVRAEKRYAQQIWHPTPLPKETTGPFGWGIQSLTKLRQDYRCDFKILEIAVFILDIYLARREVPAQKLGIIGPVCLMLAIKVKHVLRSLRAQKHAIGLTPILLLSYVTDGSTIRTPWRPSRWTSWRPLIGS